MTSILEQCPQPSILSDYLLGLLPPDQSESCEIHLSNCQPCVETIQGLEVTDTLHDLAANAVPLQLAGTSSGQQAGDSSVVGNLIHRMQNLGNVMDLSPRPVSSLTEDRAAEIMRLLEPLSPGSKSTDLGTLDGYRIEKILGAGSSGVVFQAVDESLGRTVALKILRPSLGAAARERFITEARATATIDHANVIAIYQVGVGGESDSLAYIAMQLLPGETLDEWLSRTQVLSVEEATNAAKQVADGLVAAHAQGLIHRDIKPANLWIVAGTNQVKILDFGLVRMTDENPQLTCTGMIAGTPCYMSPEQSRGADLDERSDLFSLGCVLYQSLTGKLPFESANALATLQSIQRDQPAPPASLDDKIPTDVSDLTMVLLEKSSLRRPKSATDVSNALESNREDWSFEADHYSAAKPPIKPRRVSHSQSQSGMSWGGLIATLLILGGFCWGAFMYGPQIIRIATDQGVIVIDSNDPDVKVEILQDGQLVRVVDLKTKQSIDLKAGAYEIKPVGDGNSINVENGNVILKRGEKSIVKITRQNSDSASQAQTGPLSNGRQTIGPHQIFMGDVVQVSSATNESLDQLEVNVLSDGMISLPLVGQVRAANKTCSDLQDDLNEMYKEFFKDPSILVQVVPGDTPLRDLLNAVEAQGGVGGQLQLSQLLAPFMQSSEKTIDEKAFLQLQTRVFRDRATADRLGKTDPQAATQVLQALHEELMLKGFDDNNGLVQSLNKKIASLQKLKVVRNEKQSSGPYGVRSRQRSQIDLDREIAQTETEMKQALSNYQAKKSAIRVAELEKVEYLKGEYFDAKKKLTDRIQSVNSILKELEAEGAPANQNDGNDIASWTQEKNRTEKQLELLENVTHVKRTIELDAKKTELESGARIEKEIYQSARERISKLRLEAKRQKYANQVRTSATDSAKSETPNTKPSNATSTREPVRMVNLKSLEAQIAQMQTLVEKGFNTSAELESLKLELKRRDAPVYNGLTLDHCIHKIRTERDPVQLVKPIEGLIYLVDAEESDELIEPVMKVFRRIDHDAVLSTVKARFLATRTKEQLFKLVRNEMENGNARGRGTIYKIWYDSAATEAKNKLLHYEKEIVNLFIETTKSEDKPKAYVAHNFLRKFVEGWKMSDESLKRCSKFLFDEVRKEQSPYSLRTQSNIVRILSLATPDLPGLDKWICDALEACEGNEQHIENLVNSLRQLDEKQREEAVPVVAQLVNKLNQHEANCSGVVSQIVLFFEQTDSKAAKAILAKFDLDNVRTYRTGILRAIE